MGRLRVADSADNGPWPRISGLAWRRRPDRDPGERASIVKQWIDVHGLPTTPSRGSDGRRLSASGLVDDAGDEVIEPYTITHMAHGTPLATGAADDACGAAGPFLLEVGTRRPITSQSSSA